MKYQALLDTREIACPLCGGQGLGRSFHLNGYRIGACETCGLWMLNPQPSSSTLSTYYHQVYYPNHDWVRSVDLDTIMHLSRGKQPAFRQALENLRRYAPDGQSLLDVGCGFGQFVLTAQQVGYDAWGVELDVLVAERAKSFGLKIVAGDFVDSGLALKKTFDIVTAWYVLEHVSDPMRFLRKCHELLQPGGVLLIRVPNMIFGLPFLYASTLGLSIQPSILSHIPAHLFFYTPTTLRRLVEAAGFDVFRVKHGRPIFADSGSWRDQLADRLREGIMYIADILGGSRGKALFGPCLTVYARK